MSDEDPFYSQVVEPYEDLRGVLDGYRKDEIVSRMVEYEPEELHEVIDGVMHSYGLKQAPATVAGDLEVENISVFTNIVEALDRGVTGEEQLKRFLNASVV